MADVIRRDVFRKSDFFKPYKDKVTTTEHLLTGAGSITGGAAAYLLSKLLHRNASGLSRLMYTASGAVAGGAGTHYALRNIKDKNGLTLSERYRLEKAYDALRQTRPDLWNKLEDIQDRAAINDPAKEDSALDEIGKFTGDNWGKGLAGAAGALAGDQVAQQVFDRRTLRELNTLAKTPGFGGKIDGFDVEFDSSGNTIRLKNIRANDGYGFEQRSGLGLARTYGRAVRPWRRRFARVGGAAGGAALGIGITSGVSLLANAISGKSEISLDQLNKM